MGVVAARARVCLLAAAVAAGAAATGLGCASGPEPGEGKGAWHEVRSGDTLWEIAGRYGSSVDAIRASNDVDNVRALQIGTRLWVPNGRDRGPQVSTRPPRSGGSSVGGPSRPATPRRPRQTQCSVRADRPDFAWPLKGELTSRFGKRSGKQHDGIDLAARKGSPVRAADAGRVVYSGSDLGDYGKVIVVKHAGSWATVYAHNRRNLKSKGAFVEKGDVIAEVGKTGNASGPHLHFEVRRSNVAHDPMSCLP